MGAPRPWLSSAPSPSTPRSTAPGPPTPRVRRRCTSRTRATSESRRGSRADASRSLRRRSAATWSSRRRARRNARRARRETRSQRWRARSRCPPSATPRLPSSASRPRRRRACARKRAKCANAGEYGYDGKPCNENVAYPSTCTKEIKTPFDGSKTDCTKIVDAESEVTDKGMCKQTRSVSVPCTNSVYDPAGCSADVVVKCGCMMSIKKAATSGKTVTCIATNRSAAAGRIHAASSVDERPRPPDTRPHQPPGLESVPRNDGGGRTTPASSIRSVFLRLVSPLTLRGSPSSRKKEQNTRGEKRQGRTGSRRWEAGTAPRPVAFATTEKVPASDGNAPASSSRATRAATATDNAMPSPTADRSGRHVTATAARSSSRRRRRMATRTGEGRGSSDGEPLGGGGGGAAWPRGGAAGSPTAGSPARTGGRPGRASQTAATGSLAAPDPGKRRKRRDAQNHGQTEILSPAASPGRNHGAGRRPGVRERAARVAPVRQQTSRAMRTRGASGAHPHRKQRAKGGKGRRGRNGVGWDGTGGMPPVPSQPTPFRRLRR